MLTPDSQLAELREMHRELGTDDDKWRVLSYQKGASYDVSFHNLVIYLIASYRKSQTVSNTHQV